MSIDKMHKYTPLIGDDTVNTVGVEIEVGKSYLNRLGEIVKIIQKDGGLDGKYPFIGDDGEIYKPDGRIDFAYNMGDLIKEIES